jgi:hypothetical protein
MDCFWVNETKLGRILAVLSVGLGLLFIRRGINGKSL